jgi:hypothetical protein
MEMLSKDSINTLLFVCGFPSGGTDLMKTILNAHPDMFINGEMPLLVRLSEYGYKGETVLETQNDIRRFKAVLGGLDTWNNIKNLHQADNILMDKEKKQLTVRDAMQKLFSDKNARVWGNKTPQYTENMQKLFKIFPDAHWLIVTRDPRDICLSWKNKWGKNVVFCASKWATRMKSGFEQARTKPNHCLFVRYEDLLLKTEEMCKKICRFLGIPFSKRMLEHYKYTDENPGKINYGRPIVSQNINKWADGISDKLVKRIEEVAFESMILFGYMPEYASSAQNIKPYEKYIGFLHDTVAMFFVGNRADPENNIAKRLKKIKKIIISKLSLSG